MVVCGVVTSGISANFFFWCEKEKRTFVKKSIEIRIINSIGNRIELNKEYKIETNQLIQLIVVEHCGDVRCCHHVVRYAQSVVARRRCWNTDATDRRWRNALAHFSSCTSLHESFFSQSSFALAFFASKLIIYMCIWVILFVILMLIVIGLFHRLLLGCLLLLSLA